MIFKSKISNQKSPIGILSLRPYLTIGLLSLLLTPGLIPAQERLPDDVTRQVERGIDASYNMDWDLALVHFDSVHTLYPEHPIGDFLLLSAS